MKSLTHALPLLVIASVAGTATHAFDLGKFTDKAAEVASDANGTSSANLIAIGSDLMTSFQGNEQAIRV